MTEICRVHGTK